MSIANLLWSNQSAEPTEKPHSEFTNNKNEEYIKPDFWDNKQQW